MFLKLYSVKRFLAFVLFGSNAWNEVILADGASVIIDKSNVENIK